MLGSLQQALDVINQFQPDGRGAGADGPRRRTRLASTCRRAPRTTMDIAKHRLHNQRLVGAKNADAGA